MLSVEPVGLVVLVHEALEHALVIIGDIVLVKLVRALGSQCP